MSLRFDPTTCHYRDENGHIHYNPLGSTLHPGTPVLTTTRQIFGIGVQNDENQALRNARLNEAISKRVLEDQQKRNAPLNFKASVEEKSDVTVDFSDKERYVLKRSFSSNRMTQSLKFLREKGLFTSQVTNQLNNASSLKEREQVLKEVISKHQKAFDVYYTTYIDQKYQELGGKESEVESVDSSSESDDESSESTGSTDSYEEMMNATSKRFADVSISKLESKSVEEKQEESLSSEVTKVIPKRELPEESKIRRSDSSCVIS